MSKETITSSKRRYYFGLILLLVVVFIWVSTSFITNNIFGDQHFNRPFFITYIGTSTFSLYLIPPSISYLKQKYNNKNTTAIQSAREEIHMEVRESLLENEDGGNIEENAGEELHQYKTNEKMTTKETIQLSSYFCILWFLANYTTNASLAYTTVGSMTILSSMSGLFTLAIGVFFKVERFTWIKMLAVILSIFGVVLVSWSDEVSTKTDQVHHYKLIGDLLALSGAIFYGAYTVFLKLKIDDESKVDMTLFLGFVGFFNIVLLWPLFFLLHWLGIETFSLPYNSALWGMILFNALIGTFFSDYLWLLSMLMTSPLIVTLGMTLTVPFALIGDVIFKHIIPNTQYIIGACLVIAGFFTVNIPLLFKKKEENNVDEEDEIISDDHLTYNRD